MTLSYPMIIMFVIYIFVMLLIGFWAYCLTTSFDDYILGGRRLGGVVTALSAGASDMSGWLLMGLTGRYFSKRNSGKLDCDRIIFGRLFKLAISRWAINVCKPKIIIIR